VRELTDVEARLADMDRGGIAAQVVYPTLFLIYLTDDADLDVALSRAYNRFMAQACAKVRTAYTGWRSRRCAASRNP
jgi:hypothetical protein